MYLFCAFQLFLLDVHDLLKENCFIIFSVQLYHLFINPWITIGAVKMVFPPITVFISCSVYESLYMHLEFLAQYVMIIKLVLSILLHLL